MDKIKNLSGSTDNPGDNLRIKQAIEKFTVMARYEMMIQGTQSITQENINSLKNELVSTMIRTEVAESASVSIPELSKPRKSTATTPSE